MPYNKRRIPRADADLNKYIRNTTTTLLKPDPPHNWERFGLTEEEKDGWKALHDEWVAVYTRCIDPITCTNTVLAEKNEVRKRFTKFTKDILQYMKHRPGITAGEREVFRVWKDKMTKTKRAAIDGTPEAVLQHLSGGWVKLRARVASSEGRPHIHRLADGLDICYSVLPLGAEPPQTWEQCTEMAFSTRAIEVIKLGTEHRTKIIYVFCRWRNLCEPKKSGPWGSRMEAVVA